MEIKDRFLQAFRDHVVFSKKMQGASRELRGDVYFIVFYLSDDESSWSEQDVERYNEKLLGVASYLRREAERVGVELKVTAAAARLTVPGICTMENTEEWIGQALSGYGKSTASDYQQACEKAYGYSEVPIVFALNKTFRSYAQSANRWYPHADEFSVVDCDAGERTLIHELLHQFGAYDLYYPQDLYEAAKRYLKNSVMGIGEQTAIDPLTRFLIGWTDRLEDDAALFLLATQHHTEASIRKALEDEWKK